MILTKLFYESNNLEFIDYYEFNEIPQIISPFKNICEQLFQLPYLHNLHILQKPGYR